MLVSGNFNRLAYHDYGSEMSQFSDVKIGGHMNKSSSALPTVWNTLQDNRSQRLQRARSSVGEALNGKVLPASRIADLLHQVLECGDRVCLEGNNQKQADFLARSLSQVNPQKIYGLHMVQSAIALPGLFAQPGAGSRRSRCPAHRRDVAK